MIYHVARQGEVLGEFSEEEFRVKRERGAILPEDHYWTDGMEEWAEVKSWSPPMTATVKMTVAPPSENPPAQFPKATAAVGPQDHLCLKCGHVGPPKAVFGLTLPGKRCPKCGATGMVAGATG
ncbi:MAG: GYF domain-containing protein [Chthoniobacterales bacterium]